MTPQTAPTAGHDPAALARRDEVDPDLLALPAPPKGRRYVAMTLMAFVLVASAGLLSSIRADIEYFFAPSRTIALGDVGSVARGALESNTYVTIEGTPMAATAVRYRRALTGATFEVFPLAGQRSVFVQVPADDPHAMRDFARREFSGRLVTFGDLGGRFRSVRNHFQDRLGIATSSESLLLLADEPPGSYGWALALGALCAAFIVVNLILFVRWFRPIRA